MSHDTRRLNWLPMAMLAVVLAAVLAFFGSKTRDGDKSAYFANQTLLQHLEQLDAQWELDALKAKLGLELTYDALTERRNDLDELLGQFKAAIASQQHDSASMLTQRSEALQQAIEAKAALMESFKSHNALLRNSLAFLPIAAQDVQQSLGRRAPPNISTDVNALLLASLVFSQAASDEKAVEIQMQLDTLLADDKNLPAETVTRLTLFGSHIRTLLREQQMVNQLLNSINTASTAARFEAVDIALSSEQQRAAIQAQRYRQYLLLFAAGLISLLLYAAMRLMRSHAVINGVNAELKGVNERLELHVQERTRELAGSLSLLNATLDSTADGILAVDLTGAVVGYNAQFVAMWGVTVEMLAGKTRVTTLLATKMKDPEQYIQRVEAARRRERKKSFDVLDLADGRIFERYINPQLVDGKIVGVVINYRDITDSRRAEQELQKVHRQLLETSRQAGMAEVASNVLHNVGNVLNSVNVSANLVAENIKHSKVAGLGRVAGLLRDHQQNLAAFITDDPKGKHLPGYLAQLTEHLLGEQRDAVKELECLRSNIDHIKEIVAMQQSYSKVSGVKERVSVIDLLEDTLRMNEGTLQHHGVTLVREFADVPMLNTEKHKILQILVNLVRNANYACSESDCADKRVILRVTHDDTSLKVAVIDNGVGITAENMTRIFGHGFTTRKDGHGFGLHSGALAARELGGALYVHSDGPGRGATFTLELPLQRETAHA